MLLVSGWWSPTLGNREQSNYRPCNRGQTGDPGSEEHAQAPAFLV